MKFLEIPQVGDIYNKVGDYRERYIVRELDTVECPCCPGVRRVSLKRLATGRTHWVGIEGFRSRFRRYEPSRHTDPSWGDMSPI